MASRLAASLRLTGRTSPTPRYVRPLAAPATLQFAVFYRFLLSGWYKLSQCCVSLRQLISSNAPPQELAAASAATAAANSAPVSWEEVFGSLRENPHEVQDEPEAATHER